MGNSGPTNGIHYMHSIALIRLAVIHGRRGKRTFEKINSIPSDEHYNYKAWLTFVASTLLRCPGIISWYHALSSSFLSSWPGLFGSKFRSGQNGLLSNHSTLKSYIITYTWPKD